MELHRDSSAGVTPYLNPGKMYSGFVVHPCFVTRHYFPLRKPQPGKLTRSRESALCDSERALPEHGHVMLATRGFWRLRDIPGVRRAASNLPRLDSRPRREPWTLSFRIFDTPFAC